MLFKVNNTAKYGVVSRGLTLADFLYTIFRNLGIKKSNIIAFVRKLLWILSHHFNYAIKVNESWFLDSRNKNDVGR